MSDALEEDRQLLSGCFAGDRRASEALVRKFSGLVYRSVQHTLVLKEVAFNRQDLEDLHNTVFLQLFENDLKKLRQYEGRNGCSLSSWIRLVAVRIVLNHFRKKGVEGIFRRRRQDPFDELSGLEEEGKDAGDSMEPAEQERLLEEGIRSLSPRDRLFIRLHLEGGLSIQEVAETMGISIQNAYTVKTRTIQRLRSHVMSVLNR